MKRGSPRHEASREVRRPALPPARVTSWAFVCPAVSATQGPALSERLLLSLASGCDVWPLARPRAAAWPRVPAHSAALMTW